MPPPNRDEQKLARLNNRFNDRDRSEHWIIGETDLLEIDVTKRSPIIVEQRCKEGCYELNSLSTVDLAEEVVAAIVM
jgi:hypothetical protein